MLRCVISSVPGKVGIFCIGRLYLCRLDQKKLVENWKPFCYFFPRSQGFLRWTLEPRVASAVVSVYRSTASCYSFYEKWALTLEAMPIFHLCHRQSHLDSSDPRLCLPASAQGSMHARLTEFFCSGLAHLLWQNTCQSCHPARLTICRHLSRSSGNSWSVKQILLFGTMFVFMVFHLECVFSVK